MRASEYLDDPGLRDFAFVDESGWRILVRRGYEGWASAWVKGERPAAGAIGGGRAEHPVVALPGGGEAVVRRYRRGGLMRHVNRDRYLLGHRAFDEARVTEHASAAGVRVPGVIAAGERRFGPFYRAWIATRMIAGTSGLERWLARGQPEAEAALRGAAEQIGRMHDAGITHPDLNLRNVLVVSQPDGTTRTHLIDFDRAALLPGPVDPRQRARELLRLARSARKLGVALDPAAWTALREGYGAGWPSAALPPP